MTDQKKVEELQDAELDAATGGATPKLMESISDGTVFPATASRGSAVGSHEITGAVIKIN